MTLPPLITASVPVDVSPAQARAWFLSLAEHPERYQFDTHHGFIFTQGDFGEPGARFQTEERFHGVRLTLKFELANIGEADFTFNLLQPLSNVWGRFSLAPRPDGTTDLSLAIGSDHPLTRRVLGLPLIRGAIQDQITREVTHIKTSMETIYQEETWAS